MVEEIYNLCLVDEPLTYQNMKNKAKLEFYDSKNMVNEEFIEGYIANLYLMDHGNCKPAFGI